MESLPSKTQEQIKKMSTEYAVLKLTKAGLNEDAILKCRVINYWLAWAELIGILVIMISLQPSSTNAI